VRQSGSPRAAGCASVRRNHERDCQHTLTTSNDERFYRSFHCDARQARRAPRVVRALRPTAGRIPRRARPMDGAPAHEPRRGHSSASRPESVGNDPRDPHVESAQRGAHPLPRRTHAPTSKMLDRYTRMAVTLGGSQLRAIPRPDRARRDGAVAHGVAHSTRFRPSPGAAQNAPNPAESKGVRRRGLEPRSPFGR
jgi:hypothetical protein